MKYSIPVNVKLLNFLNAMRNNESKQYNEDHQKDIAQMIKYAESNRVSVVFELEDHVLKSVTLEPKDFVMIDLDSDKIADKVLELHK